MRQPKTSRDREVRAVGSVLTVYYCTVKVVNNSVDVNRFGSVLCHLIARREIICTSHYSLTYSLLCRVKRHKRNVVRADILATLRGSQATCLLIALTRFALRRFVPERMPAAATQ